MFLVHHCLGPGLFRIHSKNPISPWYIICFVQGCLSYIPGPFTCMFLVHHCLGPGLFRIHSKTNTYYPGTSFVWSRAVSYIPEPFACMCLVHHYFSPGPFQGQLYITLVHYLFCPGLCHIHSWAAFMYTPGTSLYWSGLLKTHPGANHLSLRCICLVWSCLSYIPGP